MNPDDKAVDKFIVEEKFMAVLSLAMRDKGYGLLADTNFLDIMRRIHLEKRLRVKQVIEYGLYMLKDTQYAGVHIHDFELMSEQYQFRYL